MGRRVMAGAAVAITALIAIPGAAGGASAAMTAGTVTGGSSASNPTDLTAAVIRNQDITLAGGYYRVTVPSSGSGVLTAQQVQDKTGANITDYGSGHFVAPAAPAILYSGVISGTGSVEVTTTKRSGNPARFKPFSDGVLAISSPQTYRNGKATGLRIDPGAAVAFVAGGNTGRWGNEKSLLNTVNNGYLYSWNTRSGGDEAAWGSIESTEPGAGVVTFESGNRMSNGHRYSGKVYTLNGTHIAQRAVLSPSLSLIQSNILSFETQGPNYVAGYGKDPAPPANRSVYGGNYYSFGVDTQVVGRGVQVFSGLSLMGQGSTKKDILPASQARKFGYFGNLRGGRGQVFYIQATMQMGNGQTIVNNADGTNNTFLQTNIAGVAGALQLGGFQAVPTSAEAALHNQAIAFDYSGKYRYDAGLNAGLDKAGKIFPLRPDHGNFAIMNPGSGKAANHLVLTSPMIIHGVTNVYHNAILQLGDGTRGNSSKRTVKVDGKSYTDVYSSSYGNGMILTRRNAPTSWPTAAIKVDGLTSVYDVINNNGKIIVDNVPKALSVTGADATVSAWMSRNLLDHIIGSGSVEQRGSLPLTLAGTNTYRGGTMVRHGSVLRVAGAKALGSTGGNATKGGVANRGVLQATGSNRVISVPGDYRQGY